MLHLTFTLFITTSYKPFRFYQKNQGSFPLSFLVVCLSGLFDKFIKEAVETF